MWLSRKPAIWGLFAIGVAALSLGSNAPPQPVYAQQPTGSLPTVTGTPRGPHITVYQDQRQIKVYGGPSSYLYPAIGVLLASQQAPALGRSADDVWIQIYYPGVPGAVGWVYAPLVSLSSGANLPIVDAPPTPTPILTPTIDPTLAAAFIVPQTPTRLPTFTPPPPLEVPTFSDETANRGGRVPMGLLIFILGFIGALGTLISFLRGR